MTAPSLKNSLESVKRRLWTVGLLAGIAWTLTAVILLLIIGGWLDLLWELPPAGRISILVAAAAVGLAFLAGWLFRVGREGRFSHIARRIDRALGLGGEILTGWELEEAFGNRQPEGGTRRELRPPVRQTSDMAWMAVAHASKLAERASPSQAVPAKPAGRSALFLVGLLAAVGLLVLVVPKVAQTQWNRFLNPYGDVPPFSKITFEIEPPVNKQVIYGQSLDIRAAIRGEAVDSAELVLEDESGRVETLPMFPESDSRWRASISKVTSSAVYYVRAYRARSEKYSLRVITVPQIENVRFRIIPPAYTGLLAYEGPLPKDGVAGLPGAKVQVWATSNRPLSGGMLSITTSKMKPAENGPSAPGASDKGTDAPIKQTMKPTAAGGNEVFGEFAVTGDGKFELYVVDVDERESQQRFSGGITLLNDQRPMIRIIQPPAASLATPEAVLPVMISAEDDYGISKVELYRSLNDSRPLPAEIPLPKRPPRRFNEKVDLPLAAYGLKPGDVIKLFARVEDNDPAGAKGSESTVVTVEIISQEEFERMVRTRDGMELMLSRYREAQRRMEAAAEETEKLRKKLETQKDGDPASEETRRELKQLAKRMREEAAAMRKLGAHQLPYAMDQKLSSELNKTAKLPEEAAEAIEKMLADADLRNDALKRQLENMKKQLAQERQAFDKSAMQPMELMAAVIPLMADQERFKMLAMHQKDLAERLAAMKGRDGEDNPALKARMRELEEEQRNVRESLLGILNDIEEHVKKLPEDEHLNKLRETATKFVDDVRASGAETAMSDAEAGLAEFSGTVGHAKAQEAAEILDSFIKKCNGMGQAGEDCLSDPVFQPSMGQCMKQTLEQLLSEMGFGRGGSGFGGFQGSGSGYSAQRGFGRNLGLYGGFPGIDHPVERGGLGPGRKDLSGKETSIGGSNPDRNRNYETTAEGSVSGSSEGLIPLRYRRQIGLYFERIAEEAKEK